MSQAQNKKAEKVRSLTLYGLRFSNLFMFYRVTPSVYLFSEFCQTEAQKINCRIIFTPNRTAKIYGVPYGMIFVIILSPNRDPDLTHLALSA